MAYEDLTGRRFGRLVVLERTKPPRPCKGGDAWYLCRCDCGNTKAVRAPSLKKGDVLSCGCLRAELNEGRDYTGVRRGHFTGVRSTGERDGRSYVWEWRCDCGNIVLGAPSHIGNKGGVMQCPQCRLRDLKDQASTLSTGHRVGNGIMRGNLDAILDGKPTSRNTTGVRGVHINRKLKKYAVSIYKDGKPKFLGYYDNLSDAAAVRAKAVQMIYGEMNNSTDKEALPMNPIINALFLFAEHHSHYSDQCLDLVRHIECGDRALFSEKAKTFIRKHLDENPDLPEDVRKRILSLLESEE